MSDYLDGLIEQQPCKCGGTGTILVGKEGIFRAERCPCQITKGFNVSQREISQAWWDSHIPSKLYQEADFSVQPLVESVASILTPQQAQQLHTYCTELQDVITNSESGLIPFHSYLVSAPDRYGKVFFATTLMKNLYRAGHNPSPLISSWQLLNKRGQFDISLFSPLLQYDVLFIRLSSTGLTGALLEVLQMLLSDCEVRGIPVVILTTHTKQQLHNVNKNVDLFIQENGVTRYAYSELKYIHLPTEFKIGRAHA